jgi:hypothetical protein
VIKYVSFGQYNVVLFGGVTNLIDENAKGVDGVIVTVTEGLTAEAETTDNGCQTKKKACCDESVWLSM